MNILLIITILVSVILIVFFIKSRNYKKSVAREMSLKDQQISEISNEKERITSNLQSMRLEIDNLKKGNGTHKFTDGVLNKNKGGNYNEDLKSLLDEIETLRKEKEEEMMLRLEAEKQIELALQKTMEIQKRMDDWKVIQDSSMKDSRSAIIGVGNDLYQKLSKNTESKVKEQNQFFDNSIKNFSSYLEQITKKIEFLEKNNVEFAKEIKKITKLDNQVKPSVIQTAQNKDIAASSSTLSQDKNLDETKLIGKNIEEYLKKTGYKAKKDYIFDRDLNDQERSSVFADCLLVKKNHLYILDFKSQHYFEYYKNKSSAEQQKMIAAFKEKLDKYILYLNNPKYKNSIATIASNHNLKFEPISIIAAVLSIKELQIIDQLDYAKKFNNYNIKILDVEQIKQMIS